MRPVKHVQLLMPSLSPSVKTIVFSFILTAHSFFEMIWYMHLFLDLVDARCNH